MKSLTRAITVFTILGLFASSFALAEGTSEELEMLENSMVAAKEQMEVAKEKLKAQAEAVIPLSRVSRSSRGGGRSGFFGGFSSFSGKAKSSSGHVLIIPSAQIKPEDMANINEDMTVMSRIFEKKAGLSKSRHDRSMMFFSSGHNIGPRVIYLDGYGVLFLLNADFPLSPPVQTPQEQETSEPADPTWEETRRQIYSPEDIKPAKSNSKQKYDPEKVENLITKLKKTLKHAGNIRNLKSDEWVIVSINGTGESAGQVITTISRSQVIIQKDIDKTVRVIENPSRSDLGFSSPTVLTVRVKKADIDAYANGKLDFDKFSKKVQMFTY